MISARKWSCECKRPVFLNQKKNDMQILMDSMNHISNQLKINIIKCKLDNKKHLRLIWNLRCSASLPKNKRQTEQRDNVVMILNLDTWPKHQSQCLRDTIIPKNITLRQEASG